MSSQRQAASGRPEARPQTRCLFRPLLRSKSLELLEYFSLKCICDQRGEDGLRIRGPAVDSPMHHLIATVGMLLPLSGPASVSPSVKRG